MFSRDNDVKVQCEAQGLIELQTLCSPFQPFFYSWILVDEIKKRLNMT